MQGVVIYEDGNMLRRPLLLILLKNILCDSLWSLFANAYQMYFECEPDVTQGVTCTPLSAHFDFRRGYYRSSECEGSHCSISTNKVVESTLSEERDVQINDTLKH
jgi:hypothetical protein